MIFVFERPEDLSLLNVDLLSALEIPQLLKFSMELFVDHGLEIAGCCQR